MHFTLEATIQIDPDVRRMWREALQHSAVGLEIVISLALGYGLGWWLDGKWGTSPWLQVAGLVLGLAAGVRALVRVARAYRKSVGPDDPEALSRPAPRRRRRRRGAGSKKTVETQGSPHEDGDGA